ncbi:amidohydrolase family protein [Stieleria varia]|uniref:Amidohydrolase n=1 Tax=Stieleria varia TaxID=2528005 RepID=A0A5C6AYL9_9BACT|nr:amidohydrolase family protein [Stieleria varia]TWU05073.1 Amidohydrolase [Stieleria varia]
MRFFPIAATLLLVSAGFHHSPLRADSPWIIDTHTHFKGTEQVLAEHAARSFDPRNTLGQVFVPNDYAPIAERLGIRATVVVEAVDQDLLRFNDWVIDQADSDLICGYVAHGDLTADDFASHHQRYMESGHLKGYRIRMGELASCLESEQGRKHLAMLEQQGLVADLLIDAKQIDDVITLSNDFPKLSVVINHGFRARMVDGKPTEQWLAAVRRAGTLPNVHCKFSSLIDFSGVKPFSGEAPSDLKAYLPVFQPLMESFGEDRLIFGTNWGVCTHYGSVDAVVSLALDYLNQHGKAAVQKVMRDNAVRVYHLSAADVE